MCVGRTMGLPVRRRTPADRRRDRLAGQPDRDLVIRGAPRRLEPTKPLYERIVPRRSLLSISVFGWQRLAPWPTPLVWRADRVDRHPRERVDRGSEHVDEQPDRVHAERRRWIVQVDP